METIGCEGNNVLHTAIIKEASDSVKVILRLVEKSGEQEVIRKHHLTSHTPIPNCETNKYQIATGKASILHLIPGA